MYCPHKGLMVIMLGMIVTSGLRLLSSSNQVIFQVHGGHKFFTSSKAVSKVQVASGGMLLLSCLVGSWVVSFFFKNRKKQFADHRKSPTMNFRNFHMAHVPKL